MRHRHGIHGGTGVMHRPGWYETTVSIMSLGRRRQRYDHLVELSGAEPGDRVLDVGCGAGTLARRAARVVGPTGRVEGIDPSPEGIAYATRRASENTGFTVGGAERLPYPDDTFDVVVSSLAVHHIEPEQRPVALAQMRRVLRPDGRLLIVEVGRAHGWIARRLRGRIGPGADHDPAAEIPPLLAEAGFVITGEGDLPHGQRYFQAG